MTIGFEQVVTFAGLDADQSAWHSAAAAILPVPYDLTTSYHSGTRNGPLAIIAASQQIELFDEELGCEPAACGVHTLPPLPQVAAGPAPMVDAVQDAIAGIVGAGKFPIMLGGEHSVSVGAVRALQARHPDLCVLQLDAHADLRDSYQGTPYSHACMARRVAECCPVVQVGIRSLCAEQYAYLQRAAAITTLFARDCRAGDGWISQCVAALQGPVYISIDLDVFDPSIMPAVGTPEPGGLGWYEVLTLLRRVTATQQVVGFDIVELCPQPGLHAADFLAARLCYKLIGYCLAASVQAPH